MEITDQLRDIVAMYLEPEFFHEVGKKLGVHKNRRTQIENERIDIVERTYELLGQWHQKQGHMATIGVSNNHGNTRYRRLCCNEIISILVL